MRSTLSSLTKQTMGRVGEEIGSSARDGSDGIENELFVGRLSQGMGPWLFTDNRIPLDDATREGEA